MWILLNNQPVRVIDINFISDITTVSKEGLLNRMIVDCDWGKEKISILMAMKVFEASKIEKSWSYTSSLGSFVSFIRDNWERVKDVFPETMSGFYVGMKNDKRVYSKVYTNESVAIETRDKLLTLINSIVAELPKIQI